MHSTRQSITYRAPSPNLLLLQPQPTIFTPIKSAIKSFGNWLLGSRISRLILSSQNKSPVNFDPTSIIDDAIETQQLTIITHDNARLDTIELRPVKQSSKPEIVVIYLSGAGNLYQQDVNEYITMAKEHQCTVVTFNYRGTGNSTGAPISEDHLVTDCIAQVQRLLDNGISSKAIVLYSPSLGGAIGVKVAHYFNLVGSTIYYINFKSFSSMTDVITGLVRTLGKSGHYEYPWMKALSWLISPIVKSILWVSKWELEAFSHYTSLSPEFKTSFFVRSSKEDRATHGQKLIDDPVIPHYASIYAALKSANLPIFNTHKLKAKNITDNGHGYQCKLTDRNGIRFGHHLHSLFIKIKERQENNYKESSQEINATPPYPQYAAQPNQ